MPELALAALTTTVVPGSIYPGSTAAAPTAPSLSPMVCSRAGGA